ncbi:hypothetical protein BGZ68_003602 [Mortierella alpina]|nr:hypothetical protein BGZ68_003602 [Mortierella alpina]
MVHKRGRGEQGHEGRETKRPKNTGSHPSQQQENNHHNNNQHAYEKLKVACATSEPRNPTAAISQPSVTIDTRSTPGGSTPAATPRLAVAANGFRVNSFNIHRLLITCLMVAAKFTSDHFYSNVRYAKVGGLSLLELNQLELEFLFTTRFELNVKVEELQRVGNALLRFRNARAHPQRQRTASAQLVQHKPQAVQTVNPISSDSGHIINTTVTRVVATSTIHQKVSRYWVPSPTSPKSGPMSDRQATSASSSSSSTTITTISASERGEGSSVNSTTTVVVAVESGTQRAQLLSPPEEKQNWKGTDIQENAERIDQTHDQNQPSQNGSIATIASVEQSKEASHLPTL